MQAPMVNEVNGDEEMTWIKEILKRKYILHKKK